MLDRTTSTSGTRGRTGRSLRCIDVSDRLSPSLLSFAALALVLLLVKFRSTVVPIKATLGFLLSIGAALGAVVAVFQWGWADNLVGAASTGPIISFLPIILIAVLFGLAVDYEVFMVSHIHEAYVETNDPSGAVIRGGRQASRIVTAAALIMRMTLVPAVLALLGDKCWWLPRRLDRALPTSTSRQRPCRRRLIRCRTCAAATAATDIPISAVGSTCTTGG